MRLTLTLPHPPSTNNLYATVNGRRVLSSKGRQYHAEVARIVDRHMEGEGFGRARIAYHVTVFHPDNRRRDLSNLVKAMEDALTKAGVWHDDSQVDRFTFERSHVLPGGSLFVEIEVHEAHQPATRTEATV
jgi:crossover junction endodeoxyribonuclease RusA